ncbi:MAG: ABC transporter permease subunit, partial [Candidatus Thiodiazotropha sp.]
AVFFAVPVIIIGPIAYLVLEPFQLAVLMAVLTVVLPFCISSINKLQELSNGFEPLMNSLGASRWKRFKRLQIPAYALALVDGLKFMVPWSILGAMLGEYSGGTTLGLGAYLIGLMGNGNPDALWAITILVTVVSLLIHRALQHLTHKVQSRLRIHLADPLYTWNPSMFQIRDLFIIILGSIVAWEALRQVSGLSTFQYPGLLDVGLYVKEKGLEVLPSFEQIIGSILAALLALVITIVVAIGLALTSQLLTRVKRIIEPTILVFQVVPIVALLPLLSIFFGRDWTVGVVMAVLATIFPAYTIMSLRLRALPEHYTTMFYSFGASQRSMIYHLLLPWMITGAAAALHVVAPRVLVGVVIAEYLLSGMGLGGSIIRQTGDLDFRGYAVSALFTIFTAGFFLLMTAKIAVLVQKSNSNEVKFK